MLPFSFPGGKKINICVVGDVMIDHYVYGTCDRISPEAPVQVVDVRSESFTLGGAGNVLENLSAFGCLASLISVCGDDAESLIVDEEVNKINPFFYHLVKDASRKTTIKTRVVASKHQLLRLDKENRHTISDQYAQEVIDNLKSRIHDIDVLILSDYCKGFFSTQLIAELLILCQANNVITIVDSKDADLSKFNGATYIKPNKKEAQLATGIKIEDDISLQQACEKIVAQTNCQAVVVTLSEDGIAIYNDGKLTKIATKAIEVFDVTGAGDTVVAALAFALGNNQPIDVACNFANHAAAIVVAKVGTAVATLDEINNLL